MDGDKQRFELEECIIIVERKKKDGMVALLVEQGARVVKSIYAKGSVKQSILQDIFGLLAEENKVMLMALIPKKNAEELIATLNTEYHFNRPNTGFAFTVAVEALSF